MKQTKFLIISLGLALLFLGFSLGFYVTNQGAQVELPTEAAFIQIEEDDVLAKEEGLADAANQIALGEEEVIAEEDAAALIFEESPEELPEEPEEVLEEVAVISEPLPVISPEKEVAVNQTLSGGVWRLALLGDASPEGSYEMFAKSGGRFGGETPCNAFFGVYEMNLGEVSVTSFGDTGINCGSEEDAFLRALEAGKFTHSERGELVVASPRGDLVFTQ